MTTKAALFTFGVIADPQYVDTENGSNHAKTMTRRYRHSLDIVKQASISFLKHKTTCNVVLGDILDGKAGNLSIQDACLQDIFDETIRFSPDNWHFVMGNHDFYCYSREELKERFYPGVREHFLKDSTGIHYTFVPMNGYRFIILDSFDVSEMGSTEENIRLAKELLTAKNKNYACGSDDWFKDLSPDEERFVQCNGGISTEQMEWLSDTLRTAAATGEKCFVFGHIPTYLPSTQPNTLLFNCEEVLALLQSHGNVVAYIAGHEHAGGYAVDATGIHHITPPAPLECDEGQMAFGRIEVYEQHMEMIWTGKLPPGECWPAKMHYSTSTNKYHSMVG